MKKIKYRNLNLFSYEFSAFANEIILVSRKFFSEILISKMDVKMNLRIITKNRAADPEIVFLIKSILEPYGRSTAMPTAWELAIENLG